MGYFNQPPSINEMDFLQRDGMPWSDEHDGPETGSCWNCDHTAEVYIGGKGYYICVRERDNGNRGDVEQTDDSIRDCEGWDAY